MPYSQSGEGVPHPVTKVADAVVPQSIEDFPTAVQPIVIQVPNPEVRKSGNEVGLMVFGITIAVILSGGIALYIASSMSAEDDHKIEKLESRVEKLDQRNRDLNTRLTKLEARSEN